MIDEILGRNEKGKTIVITPNVTIIPRLNKTIEDHIPPDQPRSLPWKFILAAVPVLLIIFLLFLKPSFIGFAILSDSSQTDFNQGTHTQTIFNTTLGALTLTPPSQSGTYESRVFDAGSNASWNNLTWFSNSGAMLVVVDTNEDIHKSVDDGSTWLTTNTGFSGSNTNAVEIVALSNGTLIAVDTNERVYRSNDYGYTWAQCNADYNSPENQGPTVMTRDLSDNLYIFESDQDVWRSTDSGSTWTKTKVDFDSGTGNANAAAAAFTSNGDIYIVADDARVFESQDQGTNWAEANPDYKTGSPDAPVDMTSDSDDNLYIIGTQDLWVSTDAGLNWSQVTTDFNGGSASSAVAMTSSYNILWAADTSEDIYVSSDSGSSWILLSSNVNGPGGNILSFTSYDELPVRFQVRVDDDNSGWPIFVGYDATGGTYYSTSPTPLNLPVNRYFQYKAFFDSNDPDYYPLLKNISIDYTELISDYKSNISLNYPPQDYFSNTSNILIFNCSAADDNLINNITFYLTDPLNTSFSINDSCTPLAASATCTWSRNLSNGNYTWNCVAYDSNSQSTEGANRSLEINTPPPPDYPPNVSLTEPADAFISSTGAVTLRCNASDDNAVDNITLYHNVSGWQPITTVVGDSIDYDQSSISNGSYIWNCLAFDSEGQSDWDSNRSFRVNLTVTPETDPPNVSLVFPPDSAELGSPITFTYLVTDASDMTDCELFINNSIAQTSDSIILNTINSFTYDPGIGHFTWSVNCTDIFNNKGSSGTRSFTVSLPEPTISVQGSGGSPTRTFTCNNRIDDDGDGLIDLSDPGCESQYDQSEHDCIEDWHCTAWSPCKDRTQSRSCTDWGSCGSRDDLPDLSQDCIIPEVMMEPEIPVVDSDAVEGLEKEPTEEQTSQETIPVEIAPKEQPLSDKVRKAVEEPAVLAGILVSGVPWLALVFLIIAGAVALRRHTVNLETLRKKELEIEQEILVKDEQIKEAHRLEEQLEIEKHQLETRRRKALRILMQVSLLDKDIARRKEIIRKEQEERKSKIDELKEVTESER
ncbi:hypothetical protein ACFL0V_05355, partial [Nanoarchaeota archaeon]